MQSIEGRESGIYLGSHCNRGRVYLLTMLLFRQYQPLGNFRTSNRTDPTGEDEAVVWLGRAASSVGSGVCWDVYVCMCARLCVMCLFKG